MQRVPKPIRLVQSSWSGDAFARSPIVCYKPSGLPYYSAQHAARRQRAGPSRYEHADPIDVEDSVMHRLVDSLPLGATPYGVFRDLAEDGCASSMQLLTRGLEVVTSCRQHAAFVADCARFGLLESTYYVVVHLPECAFAVHSESVAAQQRLSSAITARFKNPYLAEHLTKSRSAQHDRHNIPREERGLQGVLNFPPPCLAGADGVCALWDSERHTLASHGVVSAQLVRGNIMRLETEDRVNTKNIKISASLSGSIRLARLFEPLSDLRDPAHSGTTATATTDSCLTCTQRHAFDTRDEEQSRCTHELFHSLPRGVELSAFLQSRRRSVAEGKTTEETLVKSPMFAFKLLGVGRRSVSMALPFLHETQSTAFFQDDSGNATAPLSPCSDGPPVAVYEITASHPHVTTETLCAIFAAHNMFVVGDPLYNLGARNALRISGDHLKRQLQHESNVVEMTAAAAHKLNSTASEDLMLRALWASQVDSLTMARRHSAVRSFEQMMTGLAAEGGQPTPMKHLFRRWLQPMVDGVGLCIARTRLRVPDVHSEINRAALQQRVVQEQHRRDGNGVVPAQLESTAYDAAGCPESFALWVAGNTRGYLSHYKIPEEESVLSCGMCQKTGHTQQQCSTSLYSEEIAPSPTAAIQAAQSEAHSEPESLLTDGNVPSTLAQLKEYVARRGAVSLDRRSIAVRGAAEVWGISTSPSSDQRQSRSKARETASAPRRQLRCKYCHAAGHHITECPKLPGEAPLDPAASRSASLQGSPRETEADSFCIKCGRFGHMYAACPKIPNGLHSAVSCCICHVSLRNVLHDPESCPRRVDVPSGYSAQGRRLAAAAATKQTSAAHQRSSNAPRSGHRQDKEQQQQYRARSLASGDHSQLFPASQQRRK